MDLPQFARNVKMAKEKGLNSVMMAISFQETAVLTVLLKLAFSVMKILINVSQFVETEKLKEMKRVMILIQKKMMDAHPTVS